ncbi:beta-amyrin 11-oxidase-like [Carica papaya]|uniref:beta-amyrin 11-oxidase-like n=1 Tax=Carica papaya TaxID=3649 RepID=UPI000B8CF0C8|nr:beta-amyrin 11-oxidase-like [Carica papaya]
MEAWWLTGVLGVVPLMICILWWWNELWHVLPLKRHLASKRAKLPPGHMGFPLIGELLTFIWYFKILRRPDDFINSKRTKYGDGVGMYRTYLFGSPSIIACSPAVTKFVFHSNLFPYRFPTNDLVGPNSMLAASGEHHDRVKGYVSAAVAHTSSLRKIVLHIQPSIKTSLRSWADKGSVIAFDVVKKMVFESIARVFVSIEPGPFLDEIGQYYACLLKGFKAQPFNIPGTTYYRAVQCRRKLMEIFRLKLEKRKENQKGDQENKDLMDVLMQIKDGDGKQLSDEEVLDNIVTLFLGGFETTATVSAWAMYYLAKNPEILQRLREENMELSSTKEGEFITLDEISQMKYTKKVVDETIRMANISCFIFRSGDYDVEYEGYLIPKGWRVLQWVRYPHANSEYFEDPMCFNPDRWNQSTKPEAYQAFGAGSMRCVGSKLAQTQLAVFLHHLVMGYKWELINPDSKITYLPHPKPNDGCKIVISRSNCLE